MRFRMQAVQLPPLRIRAALLLGAVLAWAALTGTAAAQTTLQWNFARFDQLSLRFAQQTTAKTTLGSGSLETTLAMAMELDWKVEEIDDTGVAKVTQTLRTLTLKMQPAGGEVVEYNSRREEQSSEAAEQIGQSMAPLLGAPVRLTVLPSGEIRDVQLPSQTAAALEKTPTSPTFPAKISVEEIEQLLGQASVILPGEPVEAGAQWSRTRQVTSPLGKLRLVSDYVFEGDDPRGGQKISMSTKFEFPDATPLKILEQTQQGELRFDAEAGRLLESSINQRLKTESTRGARIQTEAESTLSLKVEPNPAD